ncbi:MAG TPA: hypothetical protein DCL38_09570 [Lachnospiraceae bacterium]|nr:hypothetical protein [Lachnospiraceae bacterium]
MSDDYDYDWNYPEKSTESTVTSAKKPGSAGGSAKRPASAGRNPDRNESAEREKDTSVAVACLIFGIMGLLTSWLVIGLGLGIAALVLAVIVIKNSYYGRGYAIVGLITSVLSLLAGIILPIVILTSARNALNGLQTTLIDTLTQSVINSAGDYLPEYIRETGQDYIKQYIDELGRDYLQDYMNGLSTQQP